MAELAALKAAAAAAEKEVLVARMAREHAERKRAVAHQQAAAASTPTASAAAFPSSPPLPPMSSLPVAAAPAVASEQRLASQNDSVLISASSGAVTSPSGATVAGDPLRSPPAPASRQTSSKKKSKKTAAEPADPKDSGERQHELCIAKLKMVFVRCPVKTGSSAAALASQLLEGEYEAQRMKITLDKKKSCNTWNAWKSSLRAYVTYASSLQPLRSEQTVTMLRQWWCVRACRLGRSVKKNIVAFCASSGTFNADGEPPLVFRASAEVCRAVFDRHNATAEKVTIPWLSVYASAQAQSRSLCPP